MKYAIPLLLLLSLATLAQSRQLVQFRLRKEPAARLKVYCLEANEDGMEIEHIGTRKRETISWKDIVDSDARRLRVEFNLELTEDEKKGLIPGQEVYFKGGASVRGIVEKQDEERNQIIIRTDGMMLPYPLDRLDRIEQVKIREDEAYDEEEIYVMRLEKRPPTNWGDHRRLADYLYEIGNYEKAQEHYMDALRLRPELRPKLEPRLAQIKDIIDDEAALGVIQRAKSEANLWGRYKEATATLQAYADQHPGSQRRVLGVIDEIEEVRVRKLTVRYHRVKARETDRAIKKYLLTKAPGLEEARSWVTTVLKKELLERIGRRMDMSDEELSALQKTKASGAPHWATYANGSFVIDPNAKKGKPSGNEVRGDPDSWWANYGDVQTRSTWLRAYAAENLPELFEVVSVRETPCEMCGGTGQVKHTSIRGLKALGGRHDWKETCPRCYGARVDRGIGYR